MNEHKIICDGPMLAPGVRMERPWRCKCGVSFGKCYDNRARAMYAEHLRIQGAA